MKLCKTCGETKDFSLFHKRKASKDGLSAKCRECQSLYDKKRANLPHRVEARKAYMLTDAGKASHNKATKKWAEKNKTKRKAHLILQNAVRGGKILKPNKCQLCEETKNLEAHHDDYSKPLDVRWLCQAHHKQWHEENGEGKNAV